MNNRTGTRSRLLPDGDADQEAGPNPLQSEFDRSQMAEGLLWEDHADMFEVASAGTRVTHVRPEAIAVMRRFGLILISRVCQTSRAIAHQNRAKQIGAKEPDAVKAG